MSVTPLFLVPWLLGSAFAAVLLIAVCGWLRPVWAGPVAFAASAAVLGLFSAAVLGGAPPVTFAWIPVWNVNAGFQIDGLAVVYGGLTLAIAVLVLAYSLPYMSHHVAGSPRGIPALVSFFSLFMLFVASMLGLVTSTNLLQLFLFWDLTMICSYLLIAFDRHESAVRRAALMALVVTGVSSVLLLAAAVLLHGVYGTTDFATLLANARPDLPTTIAGALLIVAALGKSAQWPLHFWLPRAMAAPTPVSAYLHAAAMVAAGVFLLQRVQPLLERAPGIGPALLALGWVSMMVGGLLALRERDMKRILAYSTIAQYGHVVFLIGLGGAHAAASAAFFVVAHGLCKSSLFLTAGAVTMATGDHELGETGGLWRRLPLLGICAGVAAAGLAGVPLTIGFFKDELLFGASLDRGWQLLGLALCGPLLTVAYAWRFWSGIFLGPTRSHTRPLPGLVLAPVALLAVLIVAFGVLPGPVTRAAEAAVEWASRVDLSTAYHFDARPANIAAVAAFVGGALVFMALQAGGGRLFDALRHVPGPLRAYDAGGEGLQAAGRLLRRATPRTLRARVTLVLMAALAVMIAAQIASGIEPLAWRWRLRDLPLGAALLLTAVSGLVTATRRQHLHAILSLSTSTLALALVLALLGAPDVALVLVIINVLTTVLLVALLERLPHHALERQVSKPRVRRGRGQNILVAGSACALAYLVASDALSSPRPRSWIGDTFISRAIEAHASNATTAVLVDFRGLDTLGEITVVAISVLAVDTFMRSRRGQQ